MSHSRRTRAAQLLGAAALTTTAVIGGVGQAQAAPSGADSSPAPQLRPATTQVPLLAETGSEDTGLLVVFAGLLVAAGGGALWAVRRRQEALGR